MQRLAEQQAVIERYESRAKQRQASSGHSNAALKDMVTCAVCRRDQNSVALPCGHLLCTGCFGSAVDSRQRTCPYDGRKFDPSQALRILWNQDR